MKVALPPELKRRVEQKVAGGLYQDAGDVVRDALRACLDESGDRIISQAGLGGMDVSEVAFLVLASATKDMDDDIKTIMAEIKAMNAAKAKLHDEIQELNRWITEQMTWHESSCDIENDTVSPASPRRTQPHSGRTCVEILMSIMDTLQENLGGMNELSEMTSLRLQMVMDRRSKYVETLSNMMKKLAATQATLVQNLK
jgi:Arc/MetJ-type ribon-helix-helix transcriptional regulator